MSSANDASVSAPTSLATSLAKSAIAEMQELEEEILAQHAREMAEAKRKLHEAKELLASVEAEVKGNRARAHRKLRKVDQATRELFWKALTEAEKLAT